MDPNEHRSGTIRSGEEITDQKRAEQELKFSNTLLTTEMETSPDGILVVGLTGNIVSFNRRFAEMWCIPQTLIEAAVDEPVLDAVTAQVQDPDSFKAQVRHLYEHPDEASADEVVTNDGRFLDRRSAPLKMSSGQYLGRVWFFRDVTEKRRSELMLREERDFSAALLASVPGVLVLLDGQGRSVLWNTNLATWTGLSNEQLSHMDARLPVVPEDRERITAAIDQVLAKGSGEVEAGFLAPSGRVHRFQISGRRIERGGKPFVLAMGLDLTEARQSEKRLRESEERFRVLFEKAPDAIVVYSSEQDRFVDANRSAEILFACPREELLKVGPQTFYLRTQPDERAMGESFAEHNRRVLAGEDVVFERSIRNAQKKDLICEVRLVRLSSAEGDLIRGSFIDITERRRAEEKLELANTTLTYRDRVLHAVTLTVAEFVAAPSLAAAMPRALKIAAEALQVDRIIILDLSPTLSAAPGVSLSYAWQAPDVPKLDPANFTKFPRAELATWFAPLLEGKPVITHAETATGMVGQIMRQMKNLSTLLVPISVAGKYWGHIGIDDCKATRQWMSVELDTLGTLAEVIGALIMREQTQAALQKSEERFRAVSETAQDAIIMVDAAAKVIYWNHAAERIFGYTTDEAIGKNADGWLIPSRFREKAIASMTGLTPTGRGNLFGKMQELSAIRKDGVEIPIELSIKSMLLGSEWHAVAVVRDITVRKRAQEQIRHMARHDILTDLPNRAVFVDALRQAIEHAKRDGENFAVLYLDLDHFKDVNDTLGHPVGDLLLQTVAERLRANVRGMDTVARFGGDEFALIGAGIPEPAEAAVLADKLLKAISEPLSIQGNEVLTGASVGIAVYGPDSPDAESLLSHADVALYRAKADGRGTYRFFTEAMDIEVHRRVTLGFELRQAILSGQLFLLYQPQVDVDTDRIVGVEALVRWRHPTRGLVSPGEFIPLAEKSGQIVALGYWVLHEACRQTKEWLDASIAPPLIAVNVSGLQFRTPLELEADIAATLAKTALPPQFLELELTESVLMEASREHNDVLVRLRKVGLRLAIDDFGTGYSSLEYLGRFPVDRVKIAQNFMPELTRASGNAAIVKAAIGLALDLNLDVVVEGVETAAQVERIKSWGCHKVQGYYYSRPLPAGAMTAVLRTGKLVPALPVPTGTAAGRH